MLRGCSSASSPSPFRQGKTECQPIRRATSRGRVYGPTSRVHDPGCKIQGPWSTTIEDLGEHGGLCARRIRHLICEDVEFPRLVDLCDFLFLFGRCGDARRPLPRWSPVVHILPQCRQDIVPHVVGRDQRGWLEALLVRHLLTERKASDIAHLQCHQTALFAPSASDVNSICHSPIALDLWGGKDGGWESILFLEMDGSTPRECDPSWAAA